MRMLLVFTLIVLAVSGCVSHDLSENVVDDTVQRSQTDIQKIDCAYSNIEADPNYSSFDEETGIFKTFVSNTGVSDIRLSGVIVWIDDVEQDEIVFDVSDDKYLIEKDNYKEFEFDIGDYLSDDGQELTKIKVETECPSVFDTLNVPSDGWKSE